MGTSVVPHDTRLLTDVTEVLWQVSVLSLSFELDARVDLMLVVLVNDAVVALLGLRALLRWNSTLLGVGLHGVGGVLVVHRRSVVALLRDVLVHDDVVDVTLVHNALRTLVLAYVFCQYES